MKDIQVTFMERCLQLAQLGKGNVAPNPMVGAVLVYNNRIIGEGCHQEYGKGHAEVNCLNNVAETDKHLIAKSTLYVSLEPCAHYGKTPPCANLIVENKIPEVVIGCTDLFAKVNGKGITILKEAGVKVTVGILEKECIELNKRFFTFHQLKRPYIILKWAQTFDGFIAGTRDERLLISNEYTNRLVHKWRSEEAAIMVGSNTVLKDNPKLNNRLWSGKQPIRFVLDGSLKISSESNMLDGSQPTVVFNYHQQEEGLSLKYQQLKRTDNVLQQIMDYAYNNNIQSVFVEGGAALLQLFIDHNCWDEARVITNKELIVNNGVIAPSLTNAVLVRNENIFSDIISYYCPIK